MPEDQVPQQVLHPILAKIELQEQVREELIGGFVLRVEDKQLDASVKGKLARIKKELQK